MKKIPIKFRGRSVRTGEYVYGFYDEDRYGNHFIYGKENRYMNIVDPDSIEQLVGYDADGKEVYKVVGVSG